MHTLAQEKSPRMKAGPFNIPSGPLLFCNVSVSYIVFYDQVFCNDSREAVFSFWDLRVKSGRTTDLQKIHLCGCLCFIFFFF